MLKQFSLSDDIDLKAFAEIIAADCQEPARLRRRRRDHQRPAGDTSAKRWWSQTGSNRRPEACKATALPTELWPQTVHATKAKPLPAISRDIACRLPRQSAQALRLDLVGLERFELSTSRLSSARSNQLSYRPITGTSGQPTQAYSPDHLPVPQALYFVREERETKSASSRLFGCHWVRRETFPMHPMFLKRSD